MELLATSSGGLSSADTTPPSLVIDKPSGTWFNHAVNLNFEATDSGSGVEATYYSVDNAQTAETDGISLAPTLGEGLHTVRVAAIDAAGNGSNAVAATIGFDTKPPSKTWGFNRPTVKRGAYSVMKYEVYDPLPSCGLAKVHLVVYTTKWKLVRKVNLGTVATNKVKSYRLELVQGRALLVGRGRHGHRGQRLPSRP